MAKLVRWWQSGYPIVFIPMGMSKINIYNEQSYWNALQWIKCPKLVILNEKCGYGARRHALDENSRNEMNKLSLR